MSSMSGKKMSTKQEVSGGFDLDAFVGGADPTPDTPSDASERPSAPREPQTRPNPPIETEKRATGRTAPQKRKSRPDLANERVQVLLTKAELAKIKNKAGLVSTSKFVRQHLKDTGLI